MQQLPLLGGMETRPSLSGDRFRVGGQLNQERGGSGWGYTALTG